MADKLHTFAKIIIVLGVITGLFIGFTLDVPSMYDEPHPLRWVYGISIMFSAGITGAFMLGISEIIEHLQRIKKLLEGINNNR